MARRTASIIPRRIARERGMMENWTKPLPQTLILHLVDEILVFPSPIGYMLSINAGTFLPSRT
jgi:hypothetical protein